MSDNVSIIIDDHRAKAMFARLEAFAKAPPTQAMADELEQLTRQSFRNEASPLGAAWPQHSPLTVKARRKRGNPSQQRLLDTGKMYASIRRHHTDNSASVSLGEGVGDPRAVVHQFGTATAGRSRNVRIPARPFLPNAGSLPEPWWTKLRVPIESALEKATA